MVLVKIEKRKLQSKRDPTLGHEGPMLKENSTLSQELHPILFSFFVSIVRLL
jgi:hypothetical protein